MESHFALVIADYLCTEYIDFASALLPATLYQTSLAFHCSAACALHCIKQHFAELWCMESHLYLMNCIVDCLSITVVHCSNVLHFNCFEDSLSVHLEKLLCPCIIMHCSVWSYTLNFSIQVSTNFPSFVFLITRDLVLIKVLLMRLMYSFFLMRMRCICLEVWGWVSDQEGEAIALIWVAV